MIKQLLVGLDGSAHADAAVACALDLAQKHSARVVGLTVVDTEGIDAAYHTPRPMGAGSADAGLHQQNLDEARARSKKIAEAFKKVCQAKKVDFEAKVVEGDPQDEILSASILSDLVILGRETHFEFGLEEDEVDDVVGEVLTHSFRPLILVPEKSRPVKKVMMAMDFHRLADRLLFNYIHLNPFPGAKVHLVHVAEDEDQEMPDELLDYFKLHGVEVEPAILTGHHAGQAIVNYANSQKMDLLVMGIHTVSKVWAALIGSTGRYVIDNVEIPIYTQT